MAANDVRARRVNDPPNAIGGLRGVDVNPEAQTLSSGEWAAETIERRIAQCDRSELRCIGHCWRT
ncbi:MAG: hypothetical protein DWQ34_24280 [Planctomycetota bacterium]|nr:MAG: hypothetical protein DWQ29_10595 [Planctomycetota bacterium]REJ87765.1 MAG: hypothetical protein DWQ34_24280 [Planctomycetota bacterium]REK27849.1 MAG: hypothetical protein DWQ41_07030 [Planctomycetota bacterium]REK32839.1 MAG: hypothetical protein DWQ45_16655 [Planctomycetota bacterium]